MTIEEPLETVRVTPSVRRAEEWAVVLEAIGIAHRLEATDAGWALVVTAGDAAQARGVLATYDEENRDDAVVAGPFPGRHGSWIGAVVAALLVGFFAVTGPRDGGGAWFERGSASAEHILRGEVWRTVTALTLHADGAHLLGNAVACVLLITAVGQWLGSGIGLGLVLLAGAGGNALTALAHGSHHISVGASTSTFGAVGLLAALQFVAWRRGRSTSRRAWVVITASVVLLAMLGLGAGSDVLAHVFGLLVGGTLGIGAAHALRRRFWPPRPSIQRTLVFGAAAVVVGCWWIALAALSHG